MKVRFVDRMAGFGAFMVTGTMGGMVTGVASALGAGAGTVGLLGVGAATSALTVGFVATRVSAKIRTAVTGAISELAVQANIDPSLVKAVTSGPVSALRAVASLDKPKPNHLKSHDASPVPNIAKIIEEKARTVMPAAPDASWAAKETQDNLDIGPR